MPNSQPLHHGDDQPATVFVSYSRADLKRARPIIAALEAAGYRVWWDGLLEGGTRFTHITEGALEAAKAVVVLWSNTSIDSHWVHDEATRGRDRACLVPLSIDGSSPPIGFRQFQVIDVSKWRGRSDAPEIGDMLRAVAALHGEAAAPPRPALAGARGAIVSRRNLMIGGGILLTAGAGGWAAWRGGLIGGRPIVANSIAVLPFENISGDASQDYFANGLATELRAELAGNAALKVMAKTSSEAFRDSDDAVRAARRLGVAYLLSGSVRSSNQMMRIGIELTNASTGFAEWSESFDRPIDDIFSVQSEISAAVIGRLTSEMARPDRGRHVGGTDNVLAYQEYLRGVELYNKSENEVSDLAALARFDAAILADPRFAAAHAARARTLVYSAAQYGSQADIVTANAAALTSARRAVELAPDFAEAQSTLGLVVAQANLDFRGGERPFDESRRLGYGEATVMNRFALFCLWVGRFDAARAAHLRALDLDPLNAFVHRVGGVIAYGARQYEAAIAPVRRALAINPSLTGSQAIIGDAHYMLGRLAEAREAYLAETLDILGVTGLAIVERRMDNRAAAEVARKRVVDGLGSNQVTLYQQAQIAAQWGEPEVAVAALTAAYAAKDQGLVALNYDPMLDPLRTLPAVAAMIGRLGPVGG